MSTRTRNGIKLPRMNREKLSVLRNIVNPGASIKIDEKRVKKRGKLDGTGHMGVRIFLV